MIVAVLDANVLVSGFSFGGGVPDQLLRRWQDDTFVLVLSKHIVSEFRQTLEKPYFRARLDESAVTQALRLVESSARTTELKVKLSGVASHSEDDLVLATAVSANADFLVTGDRQLLRLGHVRGVAIRTPRDFLTFLDGLDADDEAAI